jgi:hypothetical protein
MLLARPENAPIKHELDRRHVWYAALRLLQQSAACIDELNGTGQTC